LKKRASEARKILVYMEHVYLGKSLAEMGRELAVSNVAAAKAMRKAEELIDSEQNIIEDILKS
ncbi:MAG: hypothetical protein KJ893_00105, partial [Candidatus Omnitrophica bacterium]|nr:hypothetical protein [Candidatus Omnitrophota bacterium]